MRPLISLGLRAAKAGVEAYFSSHPGQRRAGLCAAAIAAVGAFAAYVVDAPIDLVVDLFISIGGSD